MKICTIESCGKKQKTGGLCSMHAERKRLHGNPYYEPKRPGVACEIPGCDGGYYGKGFCLAHYKRFKKYGDPLAGGIKHGEAQDFLRYASTYSGDECLIWPYGKNSNGYGRVNYRGKIKGAHEVVTTLSRGPKPTPRHESCHSCGNGHLGCVNQKHLRWGTRKENMQDAIGHGTLRGKRRPRVEPARKHSDETLATVMSLLLDDISQVEISRLTGVSQSHISRIKNK